MKNFSGRIAVVTGGGSGIGRALVRALAAEGCHVAVCDILADNAAETKRLCEADGLSPGTRITTHVADVSDEAQLMRVREEIAAQMKTDAIHLLFNNAGIGGGHSMITDSRESWERTFGICWWGVYFGVRVFLPMLQKADEAHIINVSSVNGFWAYLAPYIPHTAYSAAKFAVKGFTEALVTDLALNAPHIKCSVVMPGHIGTSVVSNSRKIHQGVTSDRLTAAEISRQREQIRASGRDDSKITDDQLQARLDKAARIMLETAPTSAEQSAKIILAGVRAEKWRILVGEDAEILDREVRAAPENAYTTEFFDRYGPAFVKRS